MSAFGTKKPGANEAQELTFPEVLADTIAGREQYGYVGEGVAMREPLPAGTDLQAQYHEQKRLDANRMANAKVASTVSSTRHMLTHHNNYAMPKPVLGQRIFANPSLGAGGIGGSLYSARNDLRGAGGVVGGHHDYRDSMEGGELHGGVLRSAVGQRYGRDRLNARISQLNEIANAKSEWLGTPLPPGQPSESETAVSQDIEAPTSGTKLELVGHLQSIETAIDAREPNQYALTDASKMLRLLIRVGPTQSREELKDLMEWFDFYGRELQKLVNDRIDDDAEHGPVLEGRTKNFGEQIYRVVQSGRDFVKDCIAHQFDSPKDRITASKSAVKRLQLGRIANPHEAEINERLALAHGDRWWRDHEGHRVGRRNEFGSLPSASTPSSSSASSFEDEDQPPPPHQGNVYQSAYVPRRGSVSSWSHPSSSVSSGDLAHRPGASASSMSSSFTAPSISREDYDHLHSASRFSRNPRITFGERSGAYLGEDQPDENSAPTNAPQRRLKANELRPTAPAPVPTWDLEGQNATASRSRLPIGEEEDSMSASQFARMGQIPVPASLRLPPPPNPRARLNEGYSQVGRSTMLPPGSETPGAILRSAPIDNRSGLQKVYGSLGRIRNPPVKFKRSTAKERANKKLNEGIRRVYHDDSESGEGRRPPMPKHMKGKGVWDEIKKVWNLITNPFGTVSGALAKGITERKPQSASERQAMESKVQKEMEADYEKMNSNEEGEGRRRRKGGVKSLRAKLAEPPRGGMETSSSSASSSASAKKRRDSDTDSEEERKMLEELRRKKAEKEAEDAKKGKPKRPTGAKGKGFGDDLMKGFNNVVGTIGSLFGLGSRKDLPKTREGYCDLAKKMCGAGHPIRVNSGSQLKSIRANFIKKLGL